MVRVPATGKSSETISPVLGNGTYGHGKAALVIIIFWIVR